MSSLLVSGAVSCGIAYASAKYLKLSKPFERAVIVGIHSVVCHIARSIIESYVGDRNERNAAEKKAVRVNVVYIPVTLLTMPLANWLGNQLGYPALDYIQLAGLSSVSTKVGETAVYALAYLGMK